MSGYPLRVTSPEFYNILVSPFSISLALGRKQERPEDWPSERLGVALIPLGIVVREPMDYGNSVSILLAIGQPSTTKANLSADKCKENFSYFQAIREKSW